MPNKINNLVKTMVNSGTIARDDVAKLITAAQDGPGVTANERAALDKILDKHGDLFEPRAKLDLQRFMDPSMDDAIKANPYGDFDGDGLTNARELRIGSDVRLKDTDNDGLHDGVEVNKYKLDPNDAQNKLEAERAPWTTTYWPMAGSG